MSVLLRRYCQLLHNFTGEWLTGATMRVISNAFGNDAEAVIRETNIYLNGIAYTNKTKAQTLANYINVYALEDPYVVLDLCPQSHKRWLVGDGTAYISLPTLLNFNQKIHIEVYANNVKSGLRYNSALGDDRFYVYVGPSSHFTVSASNTILNLQGSSFQFDGTVENRRTYWEVNGELGTSQTFETPIVQLDNYVLFGSYQNAYRPEPGKCGRYYILNNGEERNLVAFKLGIARAAADCVPQKDCPIGTCGMIDVISGKFYPNANTSGSFTIEYTLSDGTPWTPLNQTT